MRAKVITAFVPLEGMQHFKPEEYHAYAERMESVLPADRFRSFKGYPLDACWLWGFLNSKGWAGLPPATDVPADRYPTPLHMVCSNIVQHQRTKWMCMAADEDPDMDIAIWLDYAILKQGHSWPGHPGVAEEHIVEFVEKVEEYFSLGNSDIPFPGIWEKGPVADFGDNWRFCGSTHIVPRWHLYYVDEFYRLECRRFIERTQTIPLDLPIWALTEQHTSLPFRFFQANHDATQLTNFPGV